jgi:hypothetical protein
MAEVIQWLEGLKGGAPTVIGALLGSIIGFATLVLGALFNARLNRLRDDNLRKVETRANAAALRAELAGIQETLVENSKKLRDDPPTPSESFFVPDLAHSVRMFPELASKIGLLGNTSLITESVGTYIVIDQYCETLLMAGGQLGSNMPEHRRVVAMPHRRADFVARIIAAAACPSWRRPICPSDPDPRGRRSIPVDVLGEAHVQMWSTTLRGGSPSLMDATKFNS